MNIAGIGVIRAQSYEQEPQQGSLERTLPGARLPYATLNERAPLHQDIELADGARVSIDYRWEGMARKIGCELGRFGSFTHGSDLFSPESTARRILDFARGLWDGSEEGLDILSDAIEEGVGRALDVLGNMPGWLHSLIGRTECLLRQGLEGMRAEAA